MGCLGSNITNSIPLFYQKENPLKLEELKVLLNVTTPRIGMN